MYRFFLITIIISFLIYGCANSPLHNNPMDPLCPWSDITIYGRVHDLNGDPVVNCSLSLVDQDIVTFTNDSGYYIIDSIMPLPDTLIVEAEGYLGDTVYISPNPGDVLSLDFLLYGIPVIRSESVYSYRLLTSLPTEIAGIIYETCIYDPDRIIDIKNVVVTYRDNTIHLNLDRIVDDNTGVYKAEMTYEEEGPQIFNMVGLEFVPMVEDYENIVSTGDGTNLVRFIDVVPDVVYPVEGGSLSYGDTIKWYIEPPSYDVEVNLYVTKNDSVIWGKEDLSPYDTICVFDKILSSGDYKLLVQIEDNYGDWSGKEVWFIGE